MKTTFNIVRGILCTFIISSLILMGALGAGGQGYDFSLYLPYLHVHNWIYADSINVRVINGIIVYTDSIFADTTIVADSMYTRIAVIDTANADSIETRELVVTDSILTATINASSNAVITGNTTTDDLYLYDTDASHTLNVHWNENEGTANRILNYVAAGGDRTLTMNENLTVGDGTNITITAEDNAGTLTLDNTTFEVEHTASATQRAVKLVTGTDANATLTIEGTSSIVNQDVTSDGTPTFGATTVNGNLTVNGAVADQENYSVVVNADVDVDVGETTTGTSTYTNVPNSTPGNSYWKWTKATGLGWMLDGSVGIGNAPQSAYSLRTSGTIQAGGAFVCGSYVYSSVGFYYGTGGWATMKTGKSSPHSNGGYDWYIHSGSTANTGARFFVMIDDTAAMKIDTTRTFTEYSKSHSGAVQDWSRYLDQTTDALYFTEANGGYITDQSWKKTDGTYTHQVQYAVEGWVTSASQNPTIGVLPANAIVTGVYVWVQEAFTSDGADEITVGYDASANEYITTLDVSSTGVKAPTAGATVKTVDATSRTVEIYYVNGGSEPGAGKAHVLVEYYTATVQP